MLLAAIRLTVIAYVACCAGALVAVWYRSPLTRMEVANTMTLVSLVLALIALPLLGGTNFARGASLEEDPRKLEQGPDCLDNRGRGACLLVAALAWLLTSIAWYYVTKR